MLSDPSLDWLLMRRIEGLQVGLCAGQTVLWRRLITMFREPELSLFSCGFLIGLHRTVSRKNFTNVQSFIAEPDSRAQCQALEENVKEFGLTYFGMTDRRQGVLAMPSLEYDSLFNNVVQELSTLSAPRKASRSVT